jgi:hypothetical protein
MALSDEQSLGYGVAGFELAACILRALVDKGVLTREEAGTIVGKVIREKLVVGRSDHAPNVQRTLREIAPVV